MKTTPHRVEGTAIRQKCYGLLSFSGERKNRKLELSVKDSNGQEIWTRELNFE